MINATDTRPCQTVVHTTWCDPAEHARYADDMEGTGQESHCLSRYLEAGKVGGWVRPGDCGRPVLALDCFSTAVEFDRNGLATMLGWVSDEDVRAVLSQALALIEGQ